MAGRPPGDEDVGPKLRELAIVADSWIGLSRVWDLLNPGDERKAVEEACDLMLLRLRSGLEGIGRRVGGSAQIMVSAGPTLSTPFQLCNACESCGSMERKTGQFWTRHGGSGWRRAFWCAPCAEDRVR